MRSKSNELQIHSVTGKMSLPYTTHVGAIGSRFFIELRDSERILAIRCPQCNIVYVPPRSVCGKCFAKLDEWKEVSTKGTLTTYAVVNYGEKTHPHGLKPPFIYGIIQLDGADTGLLHLIGDVNQEDLRIGMRVQAVFSRKRKGNILDIKYFKQL